MAGVNKLGLFGNETAGEAVTVFGREKTVVEPTSIGIQINDVFHYTSVGKAKMIYENLKMALHYAEKELNPRA